MAITTTREQRRIENQERALAAYMEHHAAAVALIARIQVAVTNHDTAPDPESVDWGDVGSLAHWRQGLQEIADQMFGEGEHAEA